jgi:hypothetical protein
MGEEDRDEFCYWMIVTMSRPRLCGYRTVKINHYEQFKNNFEVEIYKFDVHRAPHRNIISIAKPTRCTNVSNLFYFGMTLYIFF